MYFMGNGFETIYYFCKELHLISYRVPRTSFSSFSKQFWVPIDLLYHSSIYLSLELGISNFRDTEIVGILSGTVDSNLVINLKIRSKGLRYK